MNNDHWVKDDQMFICDGNGWILNKYLQTVCVGPVDNDGNPLPDKVSNAPETCTDEKNDVSKIEQVEIPMVNDSHEQNVDIFETSKKRGRPKKEVDYSRITRWRRKKELQQLLMEI